MIRLHRLDGSEFYLNPDHIEIIEVTPDTVITLTNGHRYVVRESVDEIVGSIVEFRRRSFPKVIVSDSNMGGCG